MTAQDAWFDHNKFLTNLIGILIFSGSYSYPARNTEIDQKQISVKAI